MSLGKNIAVIWQPHFNTNCFRVAVKKQMGDKVNYIVVCCSPEYNGVYKWNPAGKKSFEIWDNNGQKCYCVPVGECEFVQTLESIKTPELIKEIKKNQKAFIGDYRKKEDFP